MDEVDGEVSRVHLAFEARERAALVLDPDGNHIEVVWHGPTARSVESVAIERIKAPDS